VADPHSPYAPPPRFRRRLGIPRGVVAELLAEQRQCPMCVHDAARLPRNPLAPATVRVLSRLYDGEVGLADSCFGTLVSALRSDGMLDRTLVVFAADHGEEFAEHGGHTHGKSLHDEVLHVPLVARLPGGTRAGTTETAPVQQVDVLPSILDVLGVPLPARTDGEPVFREPAPVSRSIVSHLDHEGHRLIGVTDGRWRFVRELDEPKGTEPSLDVYDRLADRGEHRSLAASDPVLASYGRTQLARLLAERVDGPTTAIAPDVRQRLEALGYIGR
jgi:arylsulfatase A-like enzyme